MKDVPLYSSRLIKNYVEYLNEHHPEVNIDALLNYAGITTYQLEDGGHWFSQRQIDLFHEGMTQQTKDPDIPKNVGRNAPLLKSWWRRIAIRIGFYNTFRRLLSPWETHHFFSRASTIHTRNLGPNQVEIVVTPNPGVRRKALSMSRIGSEHFEAIAKLFTTKFASVEHPTCIHKGGGSCRYIISWEKTAFF